MSPIFESPLAPLSLERPNLSVESLSGAEENSLISLYSLSARAPSSNSCTSPSHSLLPIDSTTVTVSYSLPTPSPSPIPSSESGLSHSPAATLSPTPFQGPISRPVSANPFEYPPTAPCSPNPEHRDENVPPGCLSYLLSRFRLPPYYVIISALMVLGGNLFAAVEASKTSKTACVSGLLAALGTFVLNIHIPRRGEKYESKKDTTEVSSATTLTTENSQATPVTQSGSDFDPGALDQPSQSLSKIATRGSRPVRNDSASSALKSADKKVVYQIRKPSPSHLKQYSSKASTSTSGSTASSQTAYSVSSRDSAPIYRTIPTRRSSVSFPIRGSTSSAPVVQTSNTQPMESDTSAPYIPPWLASVFQERQRRVLRQLEHSFESVGLLPSTKERKRRRSKKKQ
ncbi:hypothetical protein GYMLUDRAFT_247342 [Collybiopsis luxurians FD-317 M1]|uniref:Uncharacterized protein n=1 Tax=Collybiopsis luxurians FD-317 M1 TaxID=944289 RepID=A0A0D0CP78_9AGAR|nr:hypothetical protein GYMLUDRAFT_247342 [Collybiopsis luxurians FD-317 M1]